MKKTRKTLLFIWKHMGKYKIYAITAFVLFGIMVLITNVIVPVYIKKITDIIQLNDFSLSYKMTIILLLLYFIARLSLFFSMHILSWFQSRLGRDLDEFSYNHFTKHSYDFYANNFTGSLVDKSKRLGLNMINIIDNILFNLFSLIVSVVGIFIVLFNENTNIAFVFLVFLIVFISLIRWMGKKMSPLYEARSIAKSKFTGVISDILTNIHTALFFENRNIDNKIFMKVNQNFHEKRYKAWRTVTNYQDGIGFLPPLFTAGITLYTVYLSSMGILTTGSVILVFLLSNNLGSQIWRLGGSAKSFVSDISDTVEAIEIIEREIDVKDPINPEIIKIHKGEIMFNNISFTYPGGDHVFEHFNLNIQSGQSVGVVGKSGSGKTTITKLLLRLYDIDRGEIVIDNQNITHITQSDLRKHIAYIPQETILFHRTIYENIAYGNPDATHDEVIDAAKSAHVDEFVQNLEYGYETKVGERGVKLSGGQRQRVGIARAMLKKQAPILIMDEATSSLDSMSEQYIQESFEKLSQKRTTIVIAHRLSTIQKLDRIIVMDHGHVLEDGSHDELLKKGGHYAELWHSQINGFIPDH